MKTRATGKLVALVAIIFIFCLTAAMAKTIEYKGGGVGYFQMTSNAFDVQWGSTGGQAGFGFYGPNISAESFASSAGSMGGSFDVAAEAFKQGFRAIDPSTLNTTASLPNGSFTALRFNGVGFVEVQINAGDLGGSTLMVCAFDADAFWIILDVDDEAAEEEEEIVIEPHVPAPFLQMVGYGFKGTAVRIIIENIGDAPTEEVDATIICGLSYKPGYWRSESVTHFEMGIYENVVIEIGQTAIFDFDLPQIIPPEKMQAFFERRGLFSSERWSYPDPWTDCLDFTLRIDGDSFHCFSPVIAF